MTEPPGNGQGDLSIGKLALCVLGAATAVLVLTTVVLVAVRPGPVLGLMVGLLGVAGAIAAMGYVSQRMTRAAYGLGDEDPRPGSGG